MIENLNIQKNEESFSLSEIITHRQCDMKHDLLGIQGRPNWRMTWTFQRLKFLLGSFFNRTKPLRRLSIKDVFRPCVPAVVRAARGQPLGARRHARVERGVVALEQRRGARGDREEAAA